MQQIAYLVERSAWLIEFWFHDRGPTFIPSLNEQLYHRLLYRGSIVAEPDLVCFSKSEAEQVCRERTVAARAALNPFWFDFFPNTTTLDEKVFWWRLQELSILDSLVPDTFDNSQEWVVWWELCSLEWTDEQRNGVWDLLDRVVLYSVREIEFEE